MDAEETETLRALPSSTIRLIGSSQVITSVYSVIKELVENSLDAQATSIDIKLEDYGHEKIEVIDNGCGVKACNVPFMVKRHFTSKLVRVEDLALLETYGFRGEALASLCAVSNLSITTKAAEEDISHVYTFDNDGDVLEKKPSHVSKGTIICAKKLFSNLPVRKQYYSNDQRKKEDLKKIENLILAYSIVKPSLRVILKQGKETAFQKTALKDIKQVLHHVFGRQVSNLLIKMDKALDDPKLSITVFLPKPGSDIREMSLSSADRTIVIVNDRPVVLSELNRILRSYYSNCHDLDNPRYPVCVVLLNLPLDEVDVNIDPNKTKVFMQHKTEVKTCLEEMLLEIYGPLDNVPSWHYAENDSHSSGARAPHQDRNVQKTHSIMYKSNSDDTAVNHHEENICLNGADKDHREEHKDDQTDPVVDVTVISEQSLPSDILKKIVKVPDSHSVTLLDMDNNEIQDMETKNLLNSSSMSPKENYLSDVVDTRCLLKEQNKSHDTSPNVESDVLTAVDHGVKSTVSESSNHIDNIINVMDKGEDVSSIDTNIDANSWARGTLNADDASSVLQPVTLLPPSSKQTPGKRPLSETEPSTSHPAKRKSLNQSPLPANQSTLYEAFNNNMQPAKKPDTAFELFCKENRPLYEAREEYDNVDELLKDAWEEMSNDEKIVYREKCWNETRRYEKEVKTSVNKVKIKEASARDQVASLASQSQAQKQKKKLKNRLYSKELIVPCAISKLNSIFFENKLSAQSENDSQPCIIGQAKLCDAWFCTIKSKVCLINTHRLMELDIYNKLKAEHILPSTLCEPVHLDSRLIGIDLIKTLEELAKANQTKEMYFTVADKRLIANGFKVKCHIDADGTLSMEMIEICNTVPTYNVKDIKSILEILSQNPDARVEETRPNKVLYFLQGEAVRMVRQNKSLKTEEDIQDILNRNVDLMSQTCLHDKPIVQNLIDLSDLECEEML